MSETDDAAARAAAIWYSESQIRDYLADTEKRERDPRARPKSEAPRSAPYEWTVGFPR